MIAYLKGNIIKKDEKFVVVNVGGIGYKVFCIASNIKINLNLGIFINDSLSVIFHLLITQICKQFLQLQILQMVIPVYFSHLLLTLMLLSDTFLHLFICLRLVFLIKNHFMFVFSIKLFFSLSQRLVVGLSDLLLICLSVSLYKLMIQMIRLCDFLC